MRSVFVIIFIDLFINEFIFLEVLWFFGIFNFWCGFLKENDVVEFVEF